MNYQLISSQLRLSVQAAGFHYEVGQLPSWMQPVARTIATGTYFPR